MKLGRAIESWDRRLAIHHPILWRMGLLRWLGTAFLLSIAGLALASLWPLRTQSIPSVEGARTWILGLQAALLFPLSFGLALAVRRGLGLWTWRQRFLAATCLSLGVVAMLLSPLFAVWRHVNRAADLVSAETLAEERAFHGAFGNWCCDPQISETAFEEHREALLAAVMKYHETDGKPMLRLRLAEEDLVIEGMQDPWQPKTQFASIPVPDRCQEPAQCVIYGTAGSAIFVPRIDWYAVDLRKAFDSLEAAKALREWQGPHVASFTVLLQGVLALSALLGLMTVLADTVRRGRPGKADLRPRWLSRPRSPWLAKLDRRLASRSPFAWTSGIHRFPWAMGLLGVAVGILWTWWIRRRTQYEAFWLWWIDGWEDGDLGPALSPYGLVVLVGLLWWLSQRVRLPDTQSIGEDVGEVMLHMATITGSVFLFLGALLLVDPGAWKEVLTYFLSEDEEGTLGLIVFWVSVVATLPVGFHFIGRRLGARAATMALGLGLVFLAVSWFAMGIASEEGTTFEYFFPLIVFAVLLAASFMLRLSRGILVTRCALLVGGVPVTATYLLFGFLELTFLDDFSDKYENLGLLVGTALVWMSALGAVAFLSASLRRWHRTPKG